eukprot:1521379-Prymnesium_polylepis.1
MGTYLPPPIRRPSSNQARNEAINQATRGRSMRMGTYLPPPIRRPSSKQARNEAINQAIRRALRVEDGHTHSATQSGDNQSIKQAIRRGLRMEGGRPHLAAYGAILTQVCSGVLRWISS